MTHTSDDKETMMEPVRTAQSNVVMRGPTPAVLDAWVEVQGRDCFLTWVLTDEDRAAIAGGANLRMGIYQYPMPPVSLVVSQAAALTPDGVALADRIRSVAKEVSPATVALPAGYWYVGRDVWAALNREGFFVGQDSVPTLMGRPLMRSMAHADVLEYVRDKP